MIALCSDKLNSAKKCSIVQIVNAKMKQGYVRVKEGIV